MKERLKLFSDLYVACKSRQGDPTEFLRHENQDYPHLFRTMAKFGQQHQNQTILKCLPSIDPNESSSCSESPTIDAYIIDGAAFVHMNPPRLSKTYGEYCETELRDKIKPLMVKSKRVDVVFDVYTPSSLKRETREKRRKGEGVRIVIKGTTPVYKKFQHVMAIDENKTELFALIAERIVNAFDTSEGCICATLLEHITSNEAIEETFLVPCTKHEADDRMFLHANELSRLGHKKLSIITVDTDVVMLSLFTVWDIDVSELWIEFGTEKNKKWLPIHLYAHKLGKDRCKAILFWYAFTGCDTVSQFQGRGKQKAWHVWQKMDKQATETFARATSIC